jgi:hypothetical protein
VCVGLALVLEKLGILGMRRGATTRGRAIA